MLRVKYYNLESNLIKEQVKIVNISDVHSDVKRLKAALDYASSIDANVITIPGDLFDSVDNIHNEEVVSTLKNIKNIEIYISNGNHDLVKINGKGFFATLTADKNLKYYESLNEEKNIHVFLNNKENFLYKGIEFVGFDPGFSWYEESKEDSQVFKDILNLYLRDLRESKNFRIMLLHSCNGLITNNSLEKDIPGINLVVSGHNHACMTPEFFQQVSKNNRGIVGPYNKVFMKGSYGFWSANSTSVILSNGLTKMGESHGSKFVRGIVNNTFKSDIDVIELNKGEKHQLKLVYKIVQK